MNGTIITNQNITTIAGQVKHFFKHDDIIIWHSFNTGMKRRIPTDFKNTFKSRAGHEPDRLKCVRRYAHVTAELDKDMNLIRIRLNGENSIALHPGDVIKFAGNRIQIRTEHLGQAEYLYETLQHWDPNGGFRNIEPEIARGFYI